MSSLNPGLNIEGTRIESDTEGGGLQIVTPSRSRFRLLGPATSVRMARDVSLLEDVRESVLRLEVESGSTTRSSAERLRADVDEVMDKVDSVDDREVRSGVVQVVCDEIISLSSGYSRFRSNSISSSGVGSDLVIPSRARRLREMVGRLADTGVTNDSEIRDGEVAVVRVRSISSSSR